MTQARSKSEEILALSQELLDDIELSRLSSHALLLKTSRLARLVDANDSIRSFLDWELRGYPSGDELANQWVDHLGRWIDKTKRISYWQPLSQIEAAIEAAKSRLGLLRVPDINIDEAIHSSNPNQYVSPARGILDPTPARAASDAIKKVTGDAAAVASSIPALTGVVSRVLAAVHQFVVGVYHERAFSGLAEDIFESLQNRIDPLLTEHCAGVLEKIPAINARLVEGDSEAISHALTSCRRIIDAFADAVSPATGEEVEIEGETVVLNQKNTRARIIKYIRDQTDSNSVRDKLRQSLNNLYGRVSTGVHADVTPTEAQSLFVETYLLLGQILDLSGPEDA